MDGARVDRLYDIEKALEKGLPDIFEKDYMSSRRTAEYIVEMMTSSNAIPPEDTAWMYWLLENAMELFETSIEFQDNGWGYEFADEMDTCYIRLAHKLNELYKKHPQLDINPFNLTHHYAALASTHFEDKRNWLYGTGERFTINPKMDFNYELSELKRLCVINDVMEPIPMTDLEHKILAETDGIKKRIESVWQEHKRIGNYKISLTSNGNIKINNVWTIYKTREGTRAKALLEQAFANDGKTFRPKLPKGSRQITQLLGDLKISGILREIFFPVVKEDGILFRSNVSEAEIQDEGIDTSSIDEELIKRGVAIDFEYNPLKGIQGLNVKGIPSETQVSFGSISNAKSFEIDLKTGEGMAELAEDLRKSFEERQKRKQDGAQEAEIIE